MRDNQIYFLFSGQFHIGFVRIKEAGYKKNFFRLFIHKKKVLIKPTKKLERNIKKDKVSRPDPLNDASIRYSDI